MDYRDHPNQKNAIFIAISDNYSFAAANLLMGLCRHSEELMKQTDFIIYHTGISEKNKRLLRQIHANTLFKEMTFPAIWEDMLNDKKTLRWGAFVIVKLFGFQLIETYEKVLFLDADMLIQNDISALFETKEEIAWRRNRAWKAQDVFGDLLGEQASKLSVPNGGLIYFTDRLRKYRITDADIGDAYDTIKNLKRCGTEERVLAWLIHDREISLKELAVKLYNTPAVETEESAKIIHFVDQKSISTKPWKNLAAYLYFEEWTANYQKWLDMGGDGPINFTKKDYFDLFAFDKVKMIDSLNKQLKEAQKLTDDANKIANDAKAIAADAREIALAAREIAEMAQKISEDSKKGSFGG